MDPRPSKGEKDDKKKKNGACMNPQKKNPSWCTIPPSFKTDFAPFLFFSFVNSKQPSSSPPLPCPRANPLHMFSMLFYSQGKRPNAAVQGVTWVREETTC